MEKCGEEKLEEIRSREKETTAAYARGIRDMFVLTVVAVMLTAVGMYTLMKMFW